MPRELQPEHPDFDAKVGDTREHKGRTYRFSENQFSGYWKAGPKDGTVGCSKDFPVLTDRPYAVGVSYFRTFEAAAEHAAKNAEAEYLRAKKIVERYERVDK